MITITLPDNAAMRALESLTPGGSEYIDDIPRCLAAVKESRRMEHNGMLMWARRAHAAEAEVTRLHQIIADIGNAAQEAIAVIAKAKVAHSQPVGTSQHLPTL